MPSREFKIGVFVIEGLNALPLSIYFMYLFFYMQDRHGFGTMENLLLGGFGGLLYMLSAAVAGKFAPKFGYLNAIAVSFAVMIVIFPLGILAATVPGQLAVYAAGVISMAFVWAPLQSLSVQGEPKRRVQRMVGIYNLVWAGMAAVGYFIGGWLVDHLTYNCIFLIPAGVHFVQLVIVLRLRAVARRDFAGASSDGRRGDAMSLHDEAEVPGARIFLKMAWIANPFAFIASNTAVPSIPELAGAFELTTTQAGVFVSVWMFARVAGFLGCWLWDGWHYRRGWLWGSYVMMVVSFILILTAPLLAVLIVAQVGFGLSVGMIYYSSLYYSMHVGDNHGKQGGVHESVIGAGNCIGPWLGAGALFLLPAQVHAATWTVTALLVVGFVWMLRTWARRG